MISVCISTYNGRDFIKKTIKSLLEQDEKDIEIIVIDDCSKDDTVDQIREAKQSDNRLQVIERLQNVGFCKNVNYALKIAKGDYFVVMGQDDLLDSNHLSEMKKTFKKDTALVFCDFDYIDENDVVFNVDDKCEHREMFAKDFIKFNSVPSVGLMMRTDVLRKAGGYPEIEEFPNYGEYHTWIRMAEQGRIEFNGNVRAKYRRHRNNMTNSFENKDVKIKLEKYFNICRKQLLNSRKLSFMDKFIVMVYMIYRSIKVR